MKYSLRTLMLDALFALPLLVAFVLVLWFAREGLEYYDAFRRYSNVETRSESERRYFAEYQATQPNHPATAANPLKN